MNFDFEGIEDMEASQVGKLNFQLNCQRDCVHILRSMVEVMAMRASLNEKEKNRVVLAVDELFANIACHGYGDKPGKVEFETKITTNDVGTEELHFMFRDYAPTVDVQGWACGGEEPCASEITPGGLGIQLIHSIMDVVQHESLTDGNRWLLVYMRKQDERDGHET